MEDNGRIILIYNYILNEIKSNKKGIDIVKLII